MKPIEIKCPKCDTIMEQVDVGVKKGILYFVCCACSGEGLKDGKILDLDKVDVVQVCIISEGKLQK